MEVRVREFGVMMSWVNNENNIQSWYLILSNTYMNRSLIYGVREHRISQGYWKCEREHNKVMYTWMGDTGMQRQEVTRTETYTIYRKQGQDLITSEFEHGMEVLGILGVVWMWQWWVPWLRTSQSLLASVTWVLEGVTVFPPQRISPQDPEECKEPMGFYVRFWGSLK